MMCRTVCLTELSSRTALTRSILSTLFLSVVALACAMPEYLDAFNKKYDIKSSSLLGKSKCMICHASMDGGTRNLYGKDVEASLKKLKAKRVNDLVLIGVEPLDSNKNGIKNIDEIQADQLPGLVKK